MTRLHTLITAAAMTAIASTASASPTPIASADLPNCDPLAALPNVMEELGTVVFPADELITAVATTISLDACPTSDPTTPNSIVSITNQTAFSFTDLHYVADPNTNFKNFDGTINGEFAVKVDNLGINRVLIAEIGGTTALVFEPGETWELILDDWISFAGFGVTDLASIGVPSTIVPDLSSGSFVANLVPEPASAALLACASALLCSRRRR